MNPFSLTHRPRIAILTAALGALGLGLGCSTATLDDDGAESAESAINASMVGRSGKTLVVGQSVDVDYTGATRFVEVGTVFTSATAGLHTVTVEPLDGAGDAALWITDAQYSNLAIARPADSRSASLDFEFRGPSTGGSRIILRDESMRPARFRVTLGAPIHPHNPDPDEGDVVGGRAPTDLVGKACDGVVGIESHHQTYDYRGQPVFASSPRKGTFTARVSFVSEAMIRLRTSATYGPGRDLHAVATSASATSPGNSPTQIDWDVPVSRDEKGTLRGSVTKGAARVTVVVGAQQLQLSFSGVISSPWHGNRVEIRVTADGTTPLSVCE